jgi:hypothetical protein
VAGTAGQCSPGKAENPKDTGIMLSKNRGFPASLRSPATTDVVLSKENHTKLTEAATLDRKSGETGP